MGSESFHASFVPEAALLRDAVPESSCSYEGRAAAGGRPPRPFGPPRRRVLAHGVDFAPAGTCRTLLQDADEVGIAVTVHVAANELPIVRLVKAEGGAGL